MALSFVESGFEPELFKK